MCSVREEMFYVSLGNPKKEQKDKTAKGIESWWLADIALIPTGVLLKMLQKLNNILQKVSVKSHQNKIKIKINVYYQCIKKQLRLCIEIIISK